MQAVEKPSDRERWERVFTSETCDYQLVGEIPSLFLRFSREGVQKIMR